MARWVVNFETHLVGGTAVWDRMLQREALNNGDPNSYAFGLVIGTHRSLKTVSHSGGWAAFSTFRSEEYTSELQSLMRISYAVFCLHKQHNNKYANYRQPKTTA